MKKDIIISRIKEKILPFLAESRVFLDEPMSRHTSLRVGGPADVFIYVEDIDELRMILKKASMYRIPVAVIGAGTNILAGGKGVRGIVVKPGKAFGYVRHRKGELVCGASVSLSRLITETEKKGLGGLEFLVGIPATCGGAVIGNAGFPDEAIGDFVCSVKAMDYSGRIRNIGRRHLNFSYRNSSLRTKKMVILEVTFAGFRKTDPRFIRKRKEFLLKRRRDTQPTDIPSAGCVFKNSGTSSAGLLIDLAGLKGRKIGGAGISEKHANFIVNYKGATSLQITELIKEIRRKVERTFHEKLKLEIKKMGVF